MNKAKIFTNEHGQAVHLPKEYQFETEEVLIQEHELGVLLIDPHKRWKMLEEVMGSMQDDFFPQGREQDTQSEREK